MARYVRVKQYVRSCARHRNRRWDSMLIVCPECQARVEAEDVGCYEHLRKRDKPSRI